MVYAYLMFMKMCSNELRVNTGQTDAYSANIEYMYY